MGDELKECSLKAQMVLGNGFGQGIAKNEQKKRRGIFFEILFFVSLTTM